MVSSSHPAALQLRCAGRFVDLSRPRVMGVLNVTPDSFSDGGALFEAGRASRDRVLRRVASMLEEGAAFIDVGGESTRPGAAPVSVSEELERVIPVVEAVAAEFETVISVDTSKPEVIREAAIAGAGMLNDVRALRLPGALEAAAATGLPVCLMHMQGEPDTMQAAPAYADVLDEVYNFLAARIGACESAGIASDAIVVDPGFGFGKAPEHNLRLLHHLERFAALGCPILVGLSRKSLLGRITGRAVHERLAASVAAATLAAAAGARIIRAHDVAATVDAVAVVNAVKNSERRDTVDE